MTLDKLPLGQEAVITAVGGEGALRCRLLDMGEEPCRSIVHKGIRACPVRRGCGNGGSGAVNGNSFRLVPDH